MFDKHSKLMMTAGIVSFLFFLISNFTNFFVGFRVLSGILQLCINAFVIIVCKNAYPHSRGIKKFFAFYGIIVPITLAIITIWRVLIPAMTS